MYAVSSSDVLGSNPALSLQILLLFSDMKLLVMLGATLTSYVVLAGIEAGRSKKKPVPMPKKKESQIFESKSSFIKC